MLTGAKRQSIAFVFPALLQFILVTDRSRLTRMKGNLAETRRERVTIDIWIDFFETFFG
jgi:hypothetical protein